MRHTAAILVAPLEVVGVRDAQDTRVDGFRDLRVSRFLASFRTETGADPELPQA